MIDDLGAWPTASQMISDHPLIGAEVWFTEDPIVSTLKPIIDALKSIYGENGLRATVISVFTQNGRTAGYEVQAVDGTTHIGHIRDFHEKNANIPRDDKQLIHAHMLARINNIMRHWNHPKEYQGPYWSGIEKIYARLSPVFNMAVIEAPVKTGEDWRLILPTTLHPVSVNIHTHTDNQTWTVETQVHDTHIESLASETMNLIGHPDPWKRGMIWAVRTTEILENDRERTRNRKVRQDMITRMGIATIFHQMKIPLLAKLHAHYEKIAGEETVVTPEYITIIVNKWDLPPGKESFYMPPYYDVDLGWIFWGTIIMHPKLSSNMQRAHEAMTHQIVHAMFGTSCERNCYKKITPEMRALMAYR